MKIYPYQLPQHLQKTLAPVYLIAGDEILLVQEARDQIRDKARTLGFDEFQYLQAGKDFAWQELDTAARTLSLFSEKCIIELHLTTGKPGRQGSATIAEYLTSPPSDKILVIVTPKLDSSQTKSKWVQACENTGVFVPIWPIDSAKFPDWIKQRLEKAGLQADLTGIKIIAANTEGNLLAAAQEIEKLRLLHGKGKLSPDIIQASCGDNARFDIFQLIDQIHQGPPAKIIRVLSRLKEEDVEPILILWSLTREIRTLYHIHQALKRGTNLMQAFKQFNIWQNRQPLVKRSLENTNSTQLESLLINAQTCDAQIKGNHPGNYWDTLTDLSLSLAGPLKGVRS